MIWQFSKRRHPIMKPKFIAVALTVLTAPLVALGDGLAPSTTSLSPSRWQSRMEFSTSVNRADWVPFGLGTSLQTASLFSDYRFDAFRLGQTGGLRLTSGLLLSQRTQYVAGEGESRTAWPYFGVGYSSGSLAGDWGFSADLGMAAQSLGATVRLSRVFGGGLSLSDAVRDLRLQPVVRLGVNYSF